MATATAPASQPDPGEKSLKEALIGGKPLDPADLDKHMLKTYFNVRLILVALGAVFPFALLILGDYRGIPFQDSMSAYYHALGKGDQSNRDLFVGGLAVVAALMLAYRAHGTGENRLLDLAGVMAIGVAGFPMEWDCKGDCGGWFSMHGFCAVVFFVCIAAVAMFCNSNTLRYLRVQNPKEADAYAWAYRAIAIAMVVLPLYAASQQNHRVFWVEAVGVWVFALYWAFKTYELKRIQRVNPALALSKAEADAPVAISKETTRAPVVPMPL